MRTFIFTTVAVFLAFLAVNVLAAHLQSDCGLRGVLGIAGCADDIRRAGFPWIFWEDGGFAYRHIFSPGLLAADGAVGMAASLIAGWAARRWWPRR
ncbi:MAG: hypothetical protein ABI847_05710 [Anaerolineales bacterium]